MISNKDVAIIFETLLTSPGMNDTVKVAVNIHRKNVLLLAKLIEVGLTLKDDPVKAGLLTAGSSESLEQLNLLADELLQKAGLTEMYLKLNSLQVKP